ncbi:MAG: hypothetical protein Kow0092_26230 [Deferrisomatales bacterium]
MRDVSIYCRVPRGQLCYFRSTLEAYEGLCIASTLPGGEGRVRLLTSPELALELRGVLEALAAEVGASVEPPGEMP